MMKWDGVVSSSGYSPSLPLSLDSSLLSLFLVVCVGVKVLNQTPTMMEVEEKMEVEEEDRCCWQRMTRNSPPISLDHVQYLF